MNAIHTDVLYAAEMHGSDRAWPVRILDTRRWTSYSSLNQWRLGELSDEWKSHNKTVGMACLYWSNTGGEPDPQDLLDFPWEPLPDEPEAVAEELTRRAHTTGSACTMEHHGSSQ